MNRTTKNIVMIVLLGLLIFISVFSVKDLKNPEHPENMRADIKTEEKLTTDTKTTEDTTKTVDEQVIMPRRPQHMRENMDMRKPQGNKNTYLFVGILISIITMYLIMSNFNKKTIKETFTGMDNIVIFIISVIVITSALTFTQSILVKNSHNDIKPPIMELKNTD